MTELIKRFIFFFFNDTATTEIYTLSLHDALPISSDQFIKEADKAGIREVFPKSDQGVTSLVNAIRSEEHTSELQSRLHIVCRLLLEKKRNVPPNRPAQNVNGTLKFQAKEKSLSLF